MGTYTNAKYYYAFGSTDIAGIAVDINGVSSRVPINDANTDSANIMALVAAGELTIAPAEGG